MSRLDDEAERQQLRLLGIDAAAHRDLLRQYERVTNRTERDLARLLARIDAARERGEDPRVSWLHRQARYQTLLAQLRDRLDDFTEQAIGVARTTQGATVAQAPQDALDLTLTSLGRAPAQAAAAVTTVFDRLPTEALDAIVGLTAHGTPLASLFTDLAPDGVDQVREALTSGVALGRPVRVIAREVMEAAEIPALRAMTITRTESLRAYRQAATETYQQSGVVRQWAWHATRSERTCPVCLAMHGTRHPLDKPLQSHPNCRCVQMPVTASWADLGFAGIEDTSPDIQTGRELLDEMSKADRLAVMGSKRLAAYNAGAISLEDLVRPTHSAVWGPGLRQASLAELGIA